jgi:hypothetical protein
MVLNWKNVKLFSTKTFHVSQKSSFKWINKRVTFGELNQNMKSTNKLQQLLYINWIATEQSM